MADNTINVWENDPGTGLKFDGGKMIEADKPDIKATTLPTSIDVAAPPVAKYAPGTDGFRYWNLAAALARASAFWSSTLPGVRWQADTALSVVMDNGEELQSEYNQATKAIQFYHASVSGKTTFTCDSPDLVCHEMGHAVLDALKPELWDSSFKEVHAFHEAFSDISSILCSLQVPSLRIALLQDTGNKIYRSSRVSRIAKQFGWCTRQINPMLAEGDCLRNAVNSLFYRDTDLLPPFGSICDLNSDPHSISRVFTGAVFEGFTGMCFLHPQNIVATLQQVSREVAGILINGARATKVSRLFFVEVATNMVHLANAMFPDIAYGQALRSAFIRHGILSLADAAEFATPRFSKDMGADVLLANQSAEPAKLVLPVSQFGLGLNSIVVQGAETIKSSNAGMDTASATAYFESLIARGRLKIDEPNPGNMRMKILRPCRQTDDSHYTHELKREGNEYVLRRLKI